MPRKNAALTELRIESVVLSLRVKIARSDVQNLGAANYTRRENDYTRFNRDEIGTPGGWQRPPGPC